MCTEKPLQSLVSDLRSNSKLGKSGECWNVGRTSIRHNEPHYLIGFNAVSFKMLEKSRNIEWGYPSLMLCRSYNSIPMQISKWSLCAMLTCPGNKGGVGYWRLIHAFEHITWQKMQSMSTMNWIAHNLLFVNCFNSYTFFWSLLCASFRVFPRSTVFM